MHKYIKRNIAEKIEKKFLLGKAIIVIGPRQVGKTTLLKNMLSQQKLSYLYLNGDEADVRELLSNTTSTALKAVIGTHKHIFIDEAQRINNIGLTLKLIVDNIQDVQVLVTGSSALELSSNINEPLTGRKFEFNLYPLSFAEMCNFHGMLEEKRLLEHRLVYGYYPEIVNNLGREKELLKLLADSYLYKDILTLGELKKPLLLTKILNALALQVGSEVSYNEVGKLVSCNIQTVEKYIDLLTKAYVIFQLPSYSGNVRNEIRKGKKIYFYDNGIRNAVINDFSYFNKRNDRGALWENFLVSERFKKNSLKADTVKSYFWRTTQQQEIDYIEESEGKLKALEFTLSGKTKKKFSKTFLNAYQDAETRVINSENFVDFVI